MTQTNVEIVRAYIAAINHNEFDRLFDYCSPDCAFYSPPYVGLGVNFDDSSGERLVLLTVAPEGPAAGILQPGDELLRVSENDQAWETFHDLKTGLWGQGVVGTSLHMRLRRGDSTLNYTLQRGLVKGMKIELAGILDAWRIGKMKEWPDLKTEIQVIFGEGDWVAAYLLNTGTNEEYHRTAIWSECDIFRFSNGRIVEIRTVEDGYANMKQLGFEIREPQREPAA